MFLISGFSFSGQGDNAALAFPTFKDWSERGAEQSAAAEIAALNEHFALPDDGTVMAVSPPPINGLGNSGGFALRLMDRSGSAAKRCCRLAILFLARSRPTRNSFTR